MPQKGLKEAIFLISVYVDWHFSVVFIGKGTFEQMKVLDSHSLSLIFLNMLLPPPFFVAEALLLNFHENLFFSFVVHLVFWVGFPTDLFF